MTVALIFASAALAPVLIWRHALASLPERLGDSHTGELVKWGSVPASLVIGYLSLAYIGSGSVAVLGGGLPMSSTSVAGGGGPSEVLFWCDWRNAPDSTETSTALRTCVNAGDWNSTMGGGPPTHPDCLVIDSSSADLSGKGWPTAKGFRIRNGNGDVFGNCQPSVTLGTAPWTFAGKDSLDVGESWWFRWYIMYDTPDSVGFDGQHGIEAVDQGSGGIWSLTHYTNRGGPRDSVEFAITANDATDHWDANGGRVNALPLNTPARMEMQFERTALDSLRLFMRVYVWNGSSYVLTYDDDDFTKREAPGAGTTLNDSLSQEVTNPTDIFPNLRNFRIGHNGFDASPGYLYNHNIQGAVAVCADTWCGAYPIAGVED